LYSLVVLCETNVLNLISQRLDTIYQIKPKRATVLFLHIFTELNTPYMTDTGKYRRQAMMANQATQQDGRSDRRQHTARDPHPTAGVVLAVGRLGGTCPHDSRHCRWEHPQPHGRSCGAHSCLVQLHAGPTEKRDPPSVTTW
jgi:hypothetical protein